MESKTSMKNAMAHHEVELAELRADRELAVEYLKAAMETQDNPDDRTAVCSRRAPWRKPLADWEWSRRNITRLETQAATDSNTNWRKFPGAGQARCTIVRGRSPTPFP